MNFTWDWARRQTVIDPPDSYVAGTVTRTYRLDGLLSTQGFPSSITETLSYDAAKRPTSISLGSAGSMTQTYDRAGSVTSDGRSLLGISGDAGTNTQTFTYDGLHRLTGASGLAAGAESYQYDLDGNRTQRVESDGTTNVTTNYTYDRTDQLQQQTIGATAKTFTYDAYGNMLQSADAASAITSYTFDEANRMTGITPPTGGGIAFTVDALDRPATRVVGDSTTDTYGYVGATETAYLTGQATPTGSLLDAEGTRLAVKTGSAVNWLVFDLHGSVAGLCPAGTSVLSDAYRYDGWGRLVDKNGGSTNPFRYRGLLNLGSDDFAGALLAMGAREYSSQLGTFTQEDSVQGKAANPGSMNRFVYALANPATLVDPDGHRALLDEGLYLVPVNMQTKQIVVQPQREVCSGACIDDKVVIKKSPYSGPVASVPDGGPKPQPGPHPDGDCVSNPSQNFCRHATQDSEGHGSSLPITTGVSRSASGGDTWWLVMTPLGGPVVVHQWFSVSTTVTTGVPSDQIGLTMTNEDFTLNIGGGLALSTDSDSGALSIAGKGVQYKTAEGTLQRPDELGLGGYYRSHITSTTSTGPVMRGLPGWDWGAGYETETVVVQDGITTGISTTARMHVTATPVVIATALVLNPGTAAALTFEEAAALTGYALAGT